MVMPSGDGLSVLNTVLHTVKWGPEQEPPKFFTTVFVILLKKALPFGERVDIYLSTH